MKPTITVLFLLCAVFLVAQTRAVTGERAPDVVRKYARTVTGPAIKSHLEVLASDEYEGRETGEPGQKKAAAYIAKVFNEMGLPAVGEYNSYYQKIGFSRQAFNSVDLAVKGQDAYRNLWDYYVFPNTNPGDLDLETKKIVFAGYGIADDRYNDYEQAKVKGKVALIYDGEPTKADGTSWLTGTTEPSDWSTDVGKKLRAAEAAGAAAVLIIDGNIKRSVAENRRFLLSPRMQLGLPDDDLNDYAPNLFISSNVAEALVGKKREKFVAKRDEINATGEPQKLKLKAPLTLEMNKMVQTLEGENVLGFIEGSDPDLKDEIVVVSAHYDHLGVRGESIYNGADDNGSGSSSLLTLAKALKLAKDDGVGPRRSVLFLLVSGEEKGLLGSQYYAEFPVFPLEQTIANVNVDMIGRTDNLQPDPYYVYVIGSDRLSTDLHKINEANNAQFTQLKLDYTYNDDNDPNRYYYRSDHYNFARKGIPAIFYFSGTHPDYHQATDTVDKIEFDKMETIARLVFHTIWDLANRDERIKVDVEGRN